MKSITTSSRRLTEPANILRRMFGRGKQRTHTHILSRSSTAFLDYALILVALLRATHPQRLKILLSSLPQSRKNDGW